MSGGEVVEAPLDGRRMVLVSLLTSASTLICCALPALMVTLGAGAALVSLTSAVPQLIWLSEHKGPIFIFGATMLALSGWMQWRARLLPCPTDPDMARLCTVQRSRSRRLYVVSLTIYAVGAFFAYIAPLFIS